MERLLRRSREPSRPTHGPGEHLIGRACVGLMVVPLPTIHRLQPQSAPHSPNSQTALLKQPERLASRIMWQQGRNVAKLGVKW